MRVSLRGSVASDLAGQFRIDQRCEGQLSDYVITLLESGDPDLEYLVDDDCIVVGRRSERGQYPPDW